MAYVTRRMKKDDRFPYANSRNQGEDISADDFYKSVFQGKEQVEQGEAERVYESYTKYVTESGDIVLNHSVVIKKNSDSSGSESAGILGLLFITGICIVCIFLAAMGSRSSVKDLSHLAENYDTKEEILEGLSACIENETEICPNANNESVVLTQSALKMIANGRLDIDVDGIYGEDTEKVVTTYQGARHLKADGIVGKDTFESMISDINRMKP